MKYMMSERELAKLAVVQGCLDGKYTVAEAGRKLGLCKRRVQKLKKAVREQGAGAVIHGNSGRHPANYTEESLRAKIVKLKGEAVYKESSFAYFRELLEEREDIRISYSALCGILKGAGIESNRKHRPTGKHFSRRERRALFGSLLQTDASSFDWFGTGQYYALHGFIDDATGKICGLYFCENECLQGYYEAFRQVLTAYGIPDELYADRSGVFFVNTKKSENWTLEERLAGKVLDKTQFGLVAETLGVTLIPAGTPQAKGRIERLWGTLQQRLPIWLALRGIDGPEAANAAMGSFMAEYNRKFAVPPRDASTTDFSPLPEKYDLNTLLAVKHERKTDACGCFSFQNYNFQIESKIPIARKRIVFLFSEKIGFMACYKKQYFSVTLLAFAGKTRVDNLPDVTKRLLAKYFLSDTRAVINRHGG
jgi:transposase